jgi:hypothetical protein
MKRIGYLTIAFLLCLGSCNGQSVKEKKETADKNLPKTDIKVNKEYDKDGNLIRYDSTYSYFYSNILNDTILGDSIFSNFKNQFNQQYFFSQKPYFNDFFFQDSLLKYDFYKNDFFSNRFKNNMQQMDKLFMEMDSIKNYYFQQQQFPELKNKKQVPKKSN